MTTSETIERGLEQLGRELGAHDDLSGKVLGEIRSRELRVGPDRRAGWIGITRRRLVAAAAAAALVLLAAAWWLSSPRTLYARALAALARAKTVHATGWTRDVFRKWPLEAPLPAQPGAAPRHPVDVWYWTADDGQPAAYERFGPVVRTRRGGNLREYQEDVKLLFVYDGGRPRDDVEKTASIAEYLKALDELNVAKVDLGTKSDGNRALQGWRVTRGNRVEEFWLDAKTDLPVRLLQSSKQPEGEVPMLELTFVFDQAVPAEIVKFEPRQAETIRYGGATANAELAWRQHVQEIGRKLADEPLRTRAAILPRKGGRAFQIQWTMPTPDGKHWVLPLDLDQHQRLSLADFFRLRVATWAGERMHGTWRLPRELHEVAVPRSDLVYADGVDWREWVDVVLDPLGLELVDVEEMRTVWVARHDGRKLKPWGEVKPPVPYIVKNGIEQKGLVAPGVGHFLRPATLDELFQDFNATIDRGELAANLPIIFDETRLPKPPPFDPQKHKSHKEYREKIVDPAFLVATDSPYFAGRESFQLARDWYVKEFGITFERQPRALTVHIVRKKGSAR